MKNAVLRAVLASTAIACAAPAAWADVYKSIGLGFEDVVVEVIDGDLSEFPSVDILDFYRGPFGNRSAVGTNSAEDRGVSFLLGRAGISQERGGFGDYGVGQMPGPIGALVTTEAADKIVGTLAQGYGVGMSFDYSLADTPAFIRVFDANGKIIVSQQLVATIGRDDCTSPKDYAYCKWGQASFAFSNVEAWSFEIESTRIAVDNLTFGSLTPFDGVVPIPEPSTYALMALGLLGVGAAARRRRVAAAAAA